MAASPASLPAMTCCACWAPLPTVCNCNRSIVANGLYRHSPDHHSTRPSTSARLPYATLRKSSPPPVVLSAALAGPSGKRLGLFFFANGRPQGFDLGQEPLKSPSRLDSADTPSGRLALER